MRDNGLENIGLQRLVYESCGDHAPTRAGRVLTVDRNAYLVLGEGQGVLAELSGRFRFTVESSPDLPCVGDAKRGKKGHLWQGRFYSSILDEKHLYAAVRYVENNPVRAKMVEYAEEYS